MPPCRAFPPAFAAPAGVEGPPGRDRHVRDAPDLAEDPPRRRERLVSLGIFVLSVVSTAEAPFCVRTRGGSLLFRPPLVFFCLLSN